MSNNQVRQFLRGRIAELDSIEEIADATDAESRLIHFQAVMRTQTDSLIRDEVGDQAVISAEDADGLVTECSLLTKIADDDASLVSGPLDLSRQIWIGTSEDGRGDHPLDSSLFVSALAATLDDPSPKPFDVGLFTSTAAVGGHSMWYHYLNYSRGLLHRDRWQIWQVTPEAETTVLEIQSAQAWVSFIESYPQEADGKLYPNWKKAAGDVDAVHVTLAAIAAMQGFRLPAVSGLTAPTFWDVESTFWLRWCFREVTMIAVE